MMWGWKVVERKVEQQIDWEHINRVMEDAGFTKRITNLEHAIFQKPRTRKIQLVPKGEKLDIEVTIARAEASLFLQARYDTFVYFDTGDLEKFVDFLVSQLQST